jgi:hypothetical protein
MTQPQQQPDAGLPDDAYPESWGYARPASNNVAAAVDVFVAGMTDAEFSALVERTRPNRGI